MKTIDKWIRGESDICTLANQAPENLTNLLPYGVDLRTGGVVIRTWLMRAQCECQELRLQVRQQWVGPCRSFTPSPARSLGNIDSA